MSYDPTPSIVWNFVNGISHNFVQCDVETATGVYSCLSVDMQFKRQLSYYVFTIYIPTFMTVRA